MSASSPIRPMSVEMSSPLKPRPSPTLFEDWASQNLDRATGVSPSVFNFPKGAVPKGSQVLLLCVITAGKGGEGALAQGLDLRTREGIVALLKGVFQLTPSMLVKASNRLWVFEVPADYPHDRLRKGVFALSQAVGFVVMRPDSLSFRTIPGIVPNFWDKVDKIRPLLLEEEVVESVELRKETDGSNIGTGHLCVLLVLKKRVAEGLEDDKAKYLGLDFSLTLKEDPKWVLSNYPSCGACGLQDHFRPVCPWVEKLALAPAFDLKKLGSTSKTTKAPKPPKVPSPPTPSLEAEGSSRPSKGKRKRAEAELEEGAPKRKEREGASKSRGPKKPKTKH